MTNDKQRLVELLEQASAEAGNYFREVTKLVLAEKGCFNSKEDIDRRTIYEVEADYLLKNGVTVESEIETLNRSKIRELELETNYLRGVKKGFEMALSRGED